ncbi:MAG: hypothetical protein EAZ89_20560, partial [Bacteroidetes bacterium]
MLSLEEIKKSYPLPLHAFGDFLLREYLQYLILRIIYDSGFASKLIFIGGTCLRILHNNSRFSEDLDFDIQGLTEKEWDELAGLIREELIAELAALGVTDATPDSALALAAYRKWGRDAAHRLYGEYSFVVLDHRKGAAQPSCLMVVDKVGVRPQFFSRG